MPEPTYETRPLRKNERDWLSEALLKRWRGQLTVGRGQVGQQSELHALLAWDGEERVGVATFVVEDGHVELVIDRNLQGSAPLPSNAGLAAG